MTVAATELDWDRLQAAAEKATRTLLAERNEPGHWVGELSTSALSTATAVSALALAARAGDTNAERGGLPRLAIDRLIDAGVEWLGSQQNSDGGWGDTPASYSNISTTLLALAAIRLAGAAERLADCVRRAEQYVAAAGSWGALRRRYGADKTFAVPILTNCALAGMIEWRAVSPLPFELSCFPQSMYRMMQLPVVSYAIPALVAIGQARYFHRPPWNPLVRWIRSRLVGPSLRILERMQPASGGYLEAVPLTSFVVMSLAATGRIDHPVTEHGLRFLAQSVRADGSWPIDTNLATWNTTLALNALLAGGRDITDQRCLDWLLNCQTKQIHPFTGAEPGGWGWTDLSGSVPDADDTPGALLALAAWSRSPRCSGPDRRRIRDAASSGVRWLLGLQNRNGGWPTFCRGWGKLPFDRSGADLTAHALRALHAWSDLADCRREIQRGVRYLAATQRPEGCWIPLWFGNQDDPREENPVYGTSKVLLAYHDLGRLSDPAARRGLAWLRGSQNADGGWGGGPAMGIHLGETGPGETGLGEAGLGESSVEETALAVEALLAAGDRPDRGLEWLVEAVESGRFRRPSPIGFYFAKLWYHERLYPIIFTASALGRATRPAGGSAERSPPKSRHALPKDREIKQPCP